jgi:hypothetical protein
MYALVIVVGDLIDRIGQDARSSSAASRSWPPRRSASSGSRAWPAIAFTLFALGLGWSFSFVAATAQLADCTSPAERGKVLGLTTFFPGLTGSCARPHRGLRARRRRRRGAAPRRTRDRARSAGWIVRYSLRVRAAELAPSALD